MKKLISCLMLALFIIINTIYCAPLTVRAAQIDYKAQMEERKLLPIQSDDYQNWPKGPAIGAKAAILMEANTHTILYAKNIDERLYPASTTKILTALIASQTCDINEMVTFSESAVHDVPAGGSNMGMDTGETLTMEQALYGVLVASANEAASAVGEHVAVKSGLPVNSFASLMNEKAKELGCKNSHFVNANGLFDENHYTSAYDLAMIGSAFFQNEMLCKMSSSPTYHIAPTATQPDDIWLSSKNALYKGREYEYPYLLGSKTGYVDLSRQTLVSGAKKDGMTLVCVVLMEESPYQFEDTISLFEYGFSNFQKLNIAEHETKYNLDQSDMFSTGNDMFGTSSSMLSLDEHSYMVIPRTASIDSLTSTTTFLPQAQDQVIATIAYTYYGQPVGTCPVLFSGKTDQFSFEQAAPADTDKKAPKVIFIDVQKLILILGGLLFLFCLISGGISMLNSYNFSTKGESNRRRKQRKKEIRNQKREARAHAKEHKRWLKQRKKNYKKRKKF